MNPVNTIWQKICTFNFQAKGYNVLILPENATQFLANSEGFRGEWVKSDMNKDGSTNLLGDRIKMQEIFIKYQLLQEKLFEKYAEKSKKEVIMILDRSIFDTKLFLRPEVAAGQWNELKKRFAESKYGSVLDDEHLKNRYDAVHEFSFFFRSLLYVSKVFVLARIFHRWFTCNHRPCWKASTKIVRTQIATIKLVIILRKRRGLPTNSAKKSTRTYSATRCNTSFTRQDAKRTWRQRFKASSSNYVIFDHVSQFFCYYDLQFCVISFVFCAVSFSTKCFKPRTSNMATHSKRLVRTLVTAQRALAVLALVVHRDHQSPNTRKVCIFITSSVRTLLAAQRTLAVLALVVDHQPPNTRKVCVPIKILFRHQ